MITNLFLIRYRSMDDLGGKDKTSGIELVKLLRVSLVVLARLLT